MNSKTKGAWIVHHTGKLQAVMSVAEFEQINFAGKCGLLLSGLASTDDCQLSNSRVEALAKAANISVRLELPSILDELSKQKLIDKGQSAVAVLGMTSSSCLTHVATIFDESAPTSSEEAVIEIAETTSILPVTETVAQEYVSDTYHLDTTETKELLSVAEQVGFLDAEQTRDGSRLLFNGNLFRRDEVNKINAIISSLSSDDSARLGELDEILRTCGCVSLSIAEKTTGTALFRKLHSIGLYDVNVVGNELGNYHFVTKPSAFIKFSSAMVDDAFDLAKAFVTSLTFGMTKSAHGRGRITMIDKLMRKLINGEWVGPATAIGQDYRVLELRGVLKVRPEKGDTFSMKLLKKDIGELALRVIMEGDTSTEVLTSIPGASIVTYQGPEQARALQRRHQSAPLKKSVGELLTQIRTGAVGT